MNLCAHESRTWRKWLRVDRSIGFAEQCNAPTCFKRLGPYLEASDLPEGVSPGECFLARKKRGATGLGGDGNARRRAYTRFMRSAKWRKQRSRVLDRDRYRCRLQFDGCVGEATEAHHVGYSDPIERTPDRDIVAACHECNAKERELRVAKAVLG